MDIGVAVVGRVDSGLLVVGENELDMLGRRLCCSV